MLVVFLLYINSETFSIVLVYILVYILNYTYFVLQCKIYIELKMV